MFTFLKARGLGVGSSLVEEDKLELAKELEEKAKAAGVQIILPSDLIVADAFAADAKTQVVQADAIPDGWMGLDNGPEATKEIQAALKEVSHVFVFFKKALFFGTLGLYCVGVFVRCCVWSVMMFSVFLTCCAARRALFVAFERAMLHTAG